MLPINQEVLTAIAAGRGRPLNPKPYPVELKLDDYTIEGLQEYAADRGLTFDEAASEWLMAHRTYVGYYRKGH